ncbi:MgtC/SapB family protein [Candidatus Woesearchaeota archaeon]|nr:MgtC/SapB family protein [Candidatus Woesearchaeota archaeon]
MLTQTDIVTRLVLAAVLAGVIGWERENIHRPAGLRTHMLVSVGAALITLVSIDAIEGGDPGRIAAGIVTGIGFIGAGTIFKDKDHVHGLTTAASVWAVSGLGIAAGVGYYFAAVTATAILLLTLQMSKLKKNRKTTQD